MSSDPPPMCGAQFAGRDVYCERFAGHDGDHSGYAGTEFTWPNPSVPASRIGAEPEPTEAQIAWALGEVKIEFDAPCDNPTCRAGVCTVVRALIASRSRVAALTTEADRARRDAAWIGALRMAGEIIRLTDNGSLDARSGPADAALDYATSVFAGTDPIQNVRDWYAEYLARAAASTRENPHE